MYTNHLTASGTFPSTTLHGNKTIETNISYAVKILKHAHAVSCPVPFVKLTQPQTWIFGAPETELMVFALDIIAILYLAVYAVFRLVGIITIASRTVIFLSQISAADAAVHSARRDKYCVHGFPFPDYL